MVPSTGNSINLPPHARWSVGKHPDDPVDGTRVAPHLANKGVGSVLGADQQDRHDRVLGALEDVVEAAVLEQPVGEARAAQ